MVKIAVLGYGTVGSGVVEVIKTNQDIINYKAGEEINIKYVLDLRDFPKDPVQELIVHDFDVILKDESIQIICEVMGGVEPAYTFVKQALSVGKSVCTSNKELVARHGPELLAIARNQKCNFLFEASVGGGIPIIRPINSSLTPENIDEITGILNGTTNYMLTKMAKEGLDYDDVLKEAQDLGFAERNPSADVEGHDACRKIAILSSLVYGYNVNYEDIYTEGITKISSEDFAYARMLGCAIKLLATSKCIKGKYYAIVAPFMLNEGHPLFNVNNVFNAIFVHGNMLGDTMFYGSGAGKLPTASAVVADVVDAARHIGKNILCYWNEEKLQLSNVEELESRFFVRVSGNASETNRVKEVFQDIELVFVPGIENEFGFVTKPIQGIEFKQKIDSIEGVLSTIRIKA